jgi:hypothetical protein
LLSPHVRGLSGNLCNLRNLRNLRIGLGEFPNTDLTRLPTREFLSLAMGEEPTQSGATFRGFHSFPQRVLGCRKARALLE